jgi:hypothetical protein
MRAVGAALTIRLMAGGTLPISLYYQFAYRFDFGLAPLHSVGLTFD